jgi:hypothetical protein
MIVVDMEEVERSTTPVSIDLVYKNTWGEMFTESYPFLEGFSVVKEHVAGLGVRDAQEMASKVKIHVPESAREMNLKRLLYQALLQNQAA